MQEDFLHYVWKHKKFNVLNLKTTNNEPVTLKTVGQHNHNSGPDFFNAQLKINEQLWAGNVEIHVKSSDWYVHNHENDSAYHNIILHVVWEHDTEVYRKDNSTIPTLELKYYVNKNMVNNYETLFSKQNKWINCENTFATVDDFILNNWLERLYFERLERKSKTIETLLKASNNDWEAVLFKMLAKNFGLKVNGDAFLSIANSFDFSIVRKLQSNVLQMEALFFGQANLLSDDIQNGYYQNLAAEYQFLKQKFSLPNDSVTPIQYFRLRPPNFPTIRLSQLAMLYHKHDNLFSKIIELHTIDDFYSLFKVSTSQFWDTHYIFDKTSKAITKTLTNSFIDLILINTIIPLKFSYDKHKGYTEKTTTLALAQQINSEKNTIISAFNDLKEASNNALHSQALLQLKAEYCDYNKCIQCAVGNALLNR